MRLRNLALGLATTVAFTGLFAWAAVAEEPECWSVEEFSGYSTMSYEGDDYAFTDDSLSSPVFVCFGDGFGTATGNDVPLVRMGTSTLAGFMDNGKGGETFVVYQLNRGVGSMLLLQSRVGTETIFPLLDDTSLVFVGKAVRVEE